MSKKLKNIIQEIFVEQKIDTLQKTEKEIKSFLGKGFIDKHINKMYLQKNNIIIETKTIEAKTEINIIKKNFNTKIKSL